MWNKKANMTYPKRMAAWLAAIVLLFIAQGNSQAKQARSPSQPARTADAFEPLSPSGQTELRAILAEGKLFELRWPNFSPYRTSVTEFYRSTGYRLAWTADGRPTPQALSMIRVFENAGAEGLNPADYDGRRWAGRVAALEASRQPLEANLVPFDVALTVSALRYISDRHFGRIDPRLLHSGFDVERGKHDLAQFLAERIVRAPNIHPALEELDPPFPGYKRTLAALQKYRKLAREYHGRPLPIPRKAVDPGNPYSAVPRLARLLRLLGDLPPHERINPSGTIYRGPLVDAIKRFQKRHGLVPDGRIGRRTFRELNTPLAHRVLQLRLSVERWRWLPDRFNRPPVIVNIPEFRLRVLGARRRRELTMKVVVGKVYGYQTPIFASTIRSVIFRPYWDVPLSIQRQELVPEIRRDHRYLARNNFEVLDRQGRVISKGKVNAAILEGLASGRLFARQRPGRRNSLGRIKFELPNDYNIYLHATPATDLFSRSRRDLSHGCVRVEDPVALAAWLLRDNPGWTPARIRNAMDGKRTFRVKLKKTVPVLIVYRTAVVSRSGQVRFFRDIYGLDAKLESVLSAGRPYPRLIATRSPW